MNISACFISSLIPQLFTTITLEMHGTEVAVPLQKQQEHFRSAKYKVRYRSFLITDSCIRLKEQEQAASKLFYSSPVYASWWSSIEQMRQPPAETKVKQTLFMLYKWGLTRPRADTRQWSSDDDVQRGGVITICFNVNISPATSLPPSVVGRKRRVGGNKNKQTGMKVLHDWKDLQRWAITQWRTHLLCEMLSAFFIRCIFR